MSRFSARVAIRPIRGDIRLCVNEHALRQSYCTQSNRLFAGAGLFNTCLLKNPRLDAVVMNPQQVKRSADVVLFPDTLVRLGSVCLYSLRLGGLVFISSSGGGWREEGRERRGRLHPSQPGDWFGLVPLACPGRRSGGRSHSGAAGWFQRLQRPCSRSGHLSCARHGLQPLCPGSAGSRSCRVVLRTSNRDTGGGDKS